MFKKFKKTRLNSSNCSVVIRCFVPIDLDKIRYVNSKTGVVLKASEIQPDQVIDKDFKVFYLKEEVYG